MLLTGQEGLSTSREAHTSEGLVQVYVPDNTIQIQVHR